MTFFIIIKVRNRLIAKITIRLIQNFVKELDPCDESQIHEFTYFLVLVMKLLNAAKRQADRICEHIKTVCTIK